MLTYLIFYFSLKSVKGWGNQVVAKVGLIKCSVFCTLMVSSLPQAAVGEKTSTCSTHHNTPALCKGEKVFDGVCFDICLLHYRCSVWREKGAPMAVTKVTRNVSKNSFLAKMY